MAGSNALSGPFNVLARLAMIVAGASLCVMVLVLAWQVIGRYALNDSPGWTEPVALTLMSIAALFGAAIAVRRESHFNFPTVVELAPAPLRAFLKMIARLIALAFGAALAWYGGFLMLDAWDVPMAGAPFPEGVSFAGLCFGGALIALFAIERLISGDYKAEEG